MGTLNSKCLILTRCENVTEEEKQLIECSDIFKIAVNYAPYKSQTRLFHDYAFWQGYVSAFTEPLITSFHMKHDKALQEAKATNRFISFYETSENPDLSEDDILHFQGGSLTPTINYTIKQKYSEILIVADNTAYDKYFQEEINKAISKYKDLANIYQFKNGNFNLPIKSIKEFTL